MTLPAVLFGVIISSLYGALFHLWRGGSVGRLIFYLALAWAGFWIGQVIAAQMGWNFLSVGALNLGFATLLSGVFLISGYWLSLMQIQRK